MSDKIYIPTFFLESGRDLFLTENLVCKHPTLAEIIDIDDTFNGFKSQEMYNNYLTVFLVDPYDHMVFLDDRGIDYESANPFDVFILKFNQYMEVFMDIADSIDHDSEQYDNYMSTNLYYNSFKFFFGVNEFYSYKDPETNNYYLITADGEFLMNDELFNYACKFIREINGISETPNKINPEDESYKRILIDDMRDEERRKKNKKKQDDDEPNDKIGCRLSSLMWVTSGYITPEEKMKIHIYDLMSGINRYDKYLQYSGVLNGIYTGNVDVKKVNLKETYWAD